jgi:hypothetical protein
MLISDVYNALRNGSHWNQTLLIITYDEHGGNFDHVPPPQGAANPNDGSVGDLGFDFTRFGVRVPTVLVSPLIQAGTVFRVPAGTTPLDHTSILRTIERRFKVLPLTARDAAAPDVGDVLTLTVARTDNALTGIKPPVSGGSVAQPDQPSHLERVQAESIAGLAIPDEEGHSEVRPVLKTSKDYKDYIKRRSSIWLKNESKWRVGRSEVPARSLKATTGGTGPRQVVLLRHGEKPGDPRDPDLSQAGQQRAAQLATEIPQRFGKPDFLFAAAPSKHSNRPVETLMPLAKALTMPLDSGIATNDFDVLADDLLHHPQFSGKLVVVCWHHTDIPGLGIALGVPKGQIDGAKGMEGMQWDPKVFNLFWSITYSGAGAKLTISEE